MPFSDDVRARALSMGIYVEDYATLSEGEKRILTELQYEESRRMVGPDTDCTCGEKPEEPCPIHGEQPLAEQRQSHGEWSLPPPKEGTASFIRSLAIQELISCLNQIDTIAKGEGEPVLCWGTEDRSTFSRGQISGLVARALKVIASEAKKSVVGDEVARHFIAPPTPGTTWEHHSGRIYTVYDITNESTEYRDKYPLTISYIGQNGKRWSGPAWDWHRRMTPLVFEPNEK